MTKKVKYNMSTYLRARLRKRAYYSDSSIRYRL